MPPYQMVFLFMQCLNHLRWDSFLHSFTMPKARLVNPVNLGLDITFDSEFRSLMNLKPAINVVGFVARAACLFDKSNNIMDEEQLHVIWISQFSDEEFYSHEVTFVTKSIVPASS